MTAEEELLEEEEGGGGTGENLGPTDSALLPRPPPPTFMATLTVEEMGNASSNWARAFAVMLGVSDPRWPRGVGGPSVPGAEEDPSTSGSSFIRARSKRPRPRMGDRMVEGFQFSAPSSATGTEVGKAGTRRIALTSGTCSAFA